MAIKYVHDSRFLAEALTPWLTESLKWVDVSIRGFEQPIEAGRSNETRFISIDHREGKVERSERYILRVAPTSHQLFLDPSLEAQCRVLQVVKHHGIPVPDVVAFEPDASVLGAPFALLEFVPGYIPSPTYNVDGWLSRAPEDRRLALWRSALSGLVAIGRVAPADVAFLGRVEYGAVGLEQDLNFTLASLEWGCASGTPERLRSLWDSLNATRPQSVDGLSWGDSRVGNMIFRGTDLAAVLDWEQVSLGGALVDLGWWLFFDRYHAAGQGMQRLAGLPTRSETLDMWVELGGQDPTGVEWYEWFAGLRLAAIVERKIQIAEQAGDDDFATTLRTNNPALRVLDLLDNA